MRALPLWRPSPDEGRAADEDERHEVELRAERAARMRESGLGPKPRPRVLLGHDAARRLLRR